MLPAVAVLLATAIGPAIGESIRTTEVFVIPVRPETFEWSSADGKTTEEADDRVARRVQRK